MSNYKKHQRPELKPAYVKKQTKCCTCENKDRIIKEFRSQQTKNSNECYNYHKITKEKIYKVTSWKTRPLSKNRS